MQVAALKDLHGSDQANVWKFDSGLYGICVLQWRIFYGAQQKKKSDQSISHLPQPLSSRLSHSYILQASSAFREADIEADARESQKIDESWLCVKASEDDVTAMLFYDEFLGDYKVSIYTNPADRPFGSFSCTEALLMRKTRDCGVSYQRQRRPCIHVHESAECGFNEDRGGQEIKEVTLESGVPFVYVISEEEYSVAFYDAEGAELEHDFSDDIAANAAPALSAQWRLLFCRFMRVEFLAENGGKYFLRLCAETVRTLFSNESARALL